MNGDSPTSPRGLPEEQRVVRDRCFHPSGTFVEFSSGEIETSVPERFEKLAVRHPQRIAVKSGKRALTYGALDRLANRIAHAVLQGRGPGQEPIALLLDNDAPLIAAILGILKAGKMCVVLDPSLPRFRIDYILRDSQSGLLVTDRKNISLAKELAHDACGLANIDELDPRLSAESPASFVSADDFTYIIYTSGSTGQPKGVLQNHRNGLHEAMLYGNGLHVSSEDRLALLYSCSASQGMKIAFGALLNGAGLYLFDLQHEGVGNLARWLIEEEITIYFSVPIVFRRFAGALTGESFPKLRLIQLGSDSVTAAEVNEYQKHFASGAALVIRLGSTETGTLRTFFWDGLCPLPNKTVPVGYGVEDMEVSLLDEEGRPVESNRVGEIAVTSRYLSPGYWRQPEITREKFRADPNDGDRRTFLTGDLGRMLPDGCLYHVGRKDFQVKIRGHRIEVAEIEAALLGLPSIREAIVAPWEEERRDEPRLAAYLVLAGRPPPSTIELRAFLKERLPEYMVPADFTFLDALPLGPNGKVDRRALPVPDWRRGDRNKYSPPPRNSLERLLEAIWTDVLKLEQIGVYDNFFDIGGHSLMATQVMSRVLAAFYVDLPLSTIFDKPTIAELAETITQAQSEAANSSL